MSHVRKYSIWEHHALTDEFYFHADTAALRAIPWVRDDLMEPAPATDTTASALPAADTTLMTTEAATADMTLMAVALPTLSVADASRLEGNSGTTTLRFVVTLSAASASAVTVKYATVNGSALAGSDYIAAAGTLTFSAGQTSKVVRVSARGDTAWEGDETLRLLLSSASGATILDGDATGTIRDDDAPPALSVADITVTEGNSGTQTATFTLRLSRAATSAVDVDWATVAGTALAGSDFRAASGHVTFAAGTTSKTVSVAIVGDTVAEATESFSLVLANVKGATVADGTAVATILDTDTPPAISVGDVTVAEGSSGTRDAVFTLTLSKASSLPVSIGWATRDGTALAGQDYGAASGTLTFAAGETTKSVIVKVTGDTTQEAMEQFSLVLSAPSGVTIADGTGLATILDDDGSGAGTGGHGFLSTQGNQIVDAAGHAVRITGVSWFGLETDTFVPHGLWARNWADMMDQMAEIGFNTIRLPFSLDALKPGAVVSLADIDLRLNPDFAKGGAVFARNDPTKLETLDIMDAIIDKAGQIGMRIILDHHRSAAGAGPNENGLWVDGGYTEQQYIDGWKLLAQRYAGNTTVIGADLANEPYNATWGDGGAKDWAAAAERVGNAIQAVNKDWLMFVEGVGNLGDIYGWWGGVLQGVKTDPVVLNVPNKVVYTPHEYGNSLYAETWFKDPSFPNNMEQHFDEYWGYIYRQNIAPVMVGEFGSRLQDPKDIAWLQKLLPYMDGDFDANGTSDIPAGTEGLSWMWWSWNPNSGDTGGILADDWKTPIQAKLDLLQPHLADMWGA